MRGSQGERAGDFQAVEGGGGGGPKAAGRTMLGNEGRGSKSLDIKTRSFVSSGLQECIRSHGRVLRRGGEDLGQDEVWGLEHGKESFRASWGHGLSHPLPPENLLTEGARDDKNLGSCLVLHKTSMDPSSSDWQPFSMVLSGYGLSNLPPSENLQLEVLGTVPGTFCMSSTWIYH